MCGCNYLVRKYHIPARHEQHHRGEQRPARIISDYFFVFMTLKTHEYLFGLCGKSLHSKPHRFFFEPGPAFRAGGGSEESDGIEFSDVGSGS